MYPASTSKRPIAREDRAYLAADSSVACLAVLGRNHLGLAQSFDPVVGTCRVRIQEASQAAYPEAFLVASLAASPAEGKEACHLGQENLLHLEGREASCRS